MRRHTEFTFDLPALRIMENEHHLLRYLMEEWHPIVLNFERDHYDLEQGHEALKALRTKLEQFVDPLTHHKRKEERYLFALLAQYIGDEQGPLMAVQEEHKEIEAYIEHFLHHTESNISAFSLEQMKEVVQDAGEAYEVITFHLIKEESIIFPMVEDILKPSEQYKLFEQLYSSII